MSSLGGCPKQEYVELHQKKISHSFADNKLFDVEVA
jgi:hypothetical protein